MHSTCTRIIVSKWNLYRHILLYKKTIPGDGRQKLRYQEHFTILQSIQHVEYGDIFIKQINEYNFVARITDCNWSTYIVKEIFTCALKCHYFQRI